MKCKELWTVIREGPFREEEWSFEQFEEHTLEVISHGYAVSVFDGECWLNICTSHSTMSLIDKDYTKVSKIDFWTCKELDCWFDRELRMMDDEDWEDEEEDY